VRRRGGHRWFHPVSSSGRILSDPAEMILTTVRLLGPTGPEHRAGTPDRRIRAYQGGTRLRNRGGSEWGFSFFRLYGQAFVGKSRTL
jgi:hypothetical protein